MLFYQIDIYIYICVILLTTKLYLRIKKYFVDKFIEKKILKMTAMPGQIYYKYLNNICRL